jgi:hypothetical protein
MRIGCISAGVFRSEPGAALFRSMGSFTEPLEFAVHYFARQICFGAKVVPIKPKKSLGRASSKMRDVIHMMGIEARSLRNSLVYEYTEDVDMLRQSILRALELVPMLETVTKKLCQESSKKA